MESLYLVIVVILFALAISDLIVGVSNDAVNFLVSAIGSKAAPFWVIMVVASLGIVFGATFSSGMMEVARKGIFHPDRFMFSEIMIIFLAVMLTDIILLDTFNSLGLPTSTTVSIVFELLGAAVAVAAMKILSSSSETLLDLTNYINTDKAILIIMGILLSVIISFSIGAVVQWIIRLIFTFNYTKSYKYFGAIWGGISISAITYFIVIKGAKGASFMTQEMITVIKENTSLILTISFVSWTLVLQLISSFTKFNILKFIVLIGTFALAMAFAGNDLVNFIGVPLAGLKSYVEYMASGIGADEFSMGVLREKVSTPTLYLLIAGMIMVMTLWFSKKARTVTQTSVNLSRQSAGPEQFSSSLIARLIVRSFIFLGVTINKRPSSIKMAINKRFDKSDKQVSTQIETPAFDLIRASVNLVVASILIAIGTSLKLPLSTTYVTFMVAMGTSLSDGAWGRESAVYRIAGVLTVIGGWFLTAFMAFTAAFIVAYLTYKFQATAIFSIVLIAIGLLIRSQIAHKKSSEEKEALMAGMNDTSSLQRDKLINKIISNVIKTLEENSTIYEDALVGLTNEDRKSLKITYKSIEKLYSNTKLQKEHIETTLKHLHLNEIETGHYYVQILDSLLGVTNTMLSLVKPTYDYVNNSHNGFAMAQINELTSLSHRFQDYLLQILKHLKVGNFNSLEAVKAEKLKLREFILTIRKSQVDRMKNGESKSKNSILIFLILRETNNMMTHSLNLMESLKAFMLGEKFKEDPEILETV